MAACLSSSFPTTHARWSPWPSATSRCSPQTVQDFARHYGCSVLPARAYHQQDKPKVELSVLLVERWILARLRIAGHKSALTFASQIAKVESLQNPNDFGTLVRGLNVYGNTIASGNALAALVVAG